MAMLFTALATNVSYRAGKTVDLLLWRVALLYFCGERRRALRASIRKGRGREGEVMDSGWCLDACSGE